MLKKKWFENNENYKLMGELYQSKNNKNYPIFLDKLDFSFWDDLDVINKCAYYYYIHYRNINFHKKLFMIDYDGYEKNKFEIINSCISKLRFKCLLLPKTFCNTFAMFDLKHAQCWK